MKSNEGVDFKVSEASVTLSLGTSSDERFVIVGKQNRMILKLQGVLQGFEECLNA